MRSRILETQYLTIYTEAPWINRDRVNSSGRHVAGIRLESARRQVHLASRVSEWVSECVLRQWPRTDWHTTLRWRCSAPSRRNSYTRPYANSGSTERRGNGDRFSAVVPGYAALVGLLHGSERVPAARTPSVSWSLARETGSRATRRPGPPLTLPQSMLYALRATFTSRFLSRRIANMRFFR